MRRVRGVYFLTVAGCLSLAACTRPGSGPIPAPEKIPVSDMIGQLKAELAAFAAATETAPVVGCGAVTGPLYMTVSNVEVKLNTEIATTGKGDVSITAPVFTAGTVTPSGGITGATDNSETVTLNFVPTATSGGPTRNTDQLNLAHALTVLRDQIATVPQGGTCLKFAEKGDQSVKLGFIASRTINGGVKFTLVVLSVDASVDSKTTATSTITVSLHFSGGVDRRGKDLPPPPVNGKKGYTRPRG